MTDGMQYVTSGLRNGKLCGWLQLVLDTACCKAGLLQTLHTHEAGLELWDCS
jgi:hypothetical protein